jgi:hypothetical protein
MSKNSKRVVQFFENWKRRPTTTQVANIDAANLVRIPLDDLGHKLLAAHGGDMANLLAVPEGELMSELASLMSVFDLVRKVFVDADTTDAAPDLRDYRAMSTGQLSSGLIAEDPVVRGSCKLVLIERMSLAGVSDIVDFIIKCEPHSCDVAKINITKKN